ncbi:DOPA 4,5-dioxygenase [Amanita muscaria]
MYSVANDSSSMIHYISSSDTAFSISSHTTMSTKPETDLQTVLDSEIKEWHFHIYFHQNNAAEHQAALELRDAVLRLRQDGAFVAVPLFRVNMDPMGPHPVGSYEIWVPSETFASVFSYLCMNRGKLSVLVHPLTREQLKDHEIRNAWIGPSFPLNLATLPIKSDEIPLQYPSLKLGYSSTAPKMSLEERRKLGDDIEAVLRGEKEAARAPHRDA